MSNWLWYYSSITKVALSALLCKCSKNVNFSWKTNKRCYKHDKCLHCKGNFFLQVFMASCIKANMQMYSKMYFCLRPRLRYTTVDVVFVLSKLFLWPFLPKKTTACMQSFYCTLWQKYHFLSFWIFSPKPITKKNRILQPEMIFDFLLIKILKVSRCVLIFRHKSVVWNSVSLTEDSSGAWTSTLKKNDIQYRVHTTLFFFVQAVVVSRIIIKR